MEFSFEFAKVLFFYHKQTRENIIHIHTQFESHVFDQHLIIKISRLDNKKLNYFIMN